MKISAEEYDNAVDAPTEVTKQIQLAIDKEYAILRECETGRTARPTAAASTIIQEYSKLAKLARKYLSSPPTFSPIGKDFQQGGGDMLFIKEHACLLQDLTLSLPQFN